MSPFAVRAGMHTAKFYPAAAANWSLSLDIRGDSYCKYDIGSNYREIKEVNAKIFMRANWGYVTDYKVKVIIDGPSKDYVKVISKHVSGYRTEVGDSVRFYPNLKEYGTPPPSNARVTIIVWVWGGFYSCISTSTHLFC